MPWYINNAGGQQPVKAATSPGSGYTQIIGASDTDTQTQALQAFVQGVANGQYGTSISAGLKKIGSAAVNAAANAAGVATGNGSSGTGCIWKLPIVGCVLTTTEVRALVGGLVMGAAAVGGIIALVLLGTGAGAGSGVTGAAGGALEGVGAGIAFVPGLEGPGMALGATGAAARRASSNSGARQSLNRRASQQAAAQQGAT
jgi:hypothetical protein